MTYAEYFRRRQEMFEIHKREALTEQEVDELITLISQLPCTGPSEPVFGGPGQHIGITADILDRGIEIGGVQLPPGVGCVHCTELAVFKWVKSAHEARRNGQPEPWPSWLPKPQG